MKYNYPINVEDIDKIHEIMSQRPESGLSFGFIEVLEAIVLVVIILLVLLFLLYEPGIGSVIALMIIPLSISYLFSIFSTDNIEDDWKKDISAAVKPSLSNEKEYQKFRNSMMRYLETKNIDLVENCETSPVPDSLRDNYYMTYPINNILCDASETHLSGEVVFLNENSVVKKFSYETSLNENSNYLTFIIKGIE